VCRVGLRRECREKLHVCEHMDKFTDANVCNCACVRVTPPRLCVVYNTRARACVWCVRGGHAPSAYIVGLYPVHMGVYMWACMKRHIHAYIHRYVGHAPSIYIYIYMTVYIYICRFIHAFMYIPMCTGYRPRPFASRCIGRRLFIYCTKSL
jgi:hypothetical protein